MSNLEYEKYGNETPKTLIIWLHGLGADGFDFLPISKELKYNGVEDTLFIFPHAPVIPVTINGGMKMRAWYDILDMSIDRVIDQNGISKSISSVHELFQTLERKYTPIKLILAGFSQGGAVCLEYVNKYYEDIDGAIALSCYLTNDFNPINISYPIFLGHGLLDPIVPITLGEKSKQEIGRHNKINWHTYNIGHNVSSDEIIDISNYLGKLINE